MDCVTAMLCYCERMRNITVSIPDEAYRQARIRAAHLGRSVSSLVAEYLASLEDGEAEFARLEALQLRAQDEIESFSASDRLTRDQVHDRAVR